MYIKQLEIDNFKSFANKSEIPFRKGFTTVSGPNGSGKSNIIDSVMFALGLRSGSALRVENLSDFISSFNNKNEATVKVTFGDVDGNKELTVARRIRKTNQGFASTYYLNDKIDTLSNIRAILEQYNITPNSYNVMMQGDVTSIITCSDRARRTIIDEIAGVADFDRRIEQATGELQTVEQRVERASLILSEVEQDLERTKEEREVALKYKKLKDEKSALESQVSTVKFFDIKRNIELAHENILQSNKKLKEEQADKKDLEEKIKLVNEKYEELDEKLKEQGEEERNKLKDEQGNLNTQIEIKKSGIKNCDTMVQKGLQTIENNKNGIEQCKKNTEEENLHIKLANEKIEIIDGQLKEKKDELKKKLSEISGISETADQYIQDRNETSQQLDELKDKDNSLFQESLKKENEYKNLKKDVDEAKEFISKTLDAKNNFGDDKSLKELEVSNLKKEMDELKELQTKTIQQLDDAKSAMEQYDYDVRAAHRRFTEMEAQRKTMSASGSSIPITTVMNAHLEGVHAPLMQLGSVDEEYSLALDVAFGGRLAHIVVDDTHAAYVAMELLNSSRAGRATFIPLNKVKKAPSKLQLPKNKGVIDFAINLIDFDDIYIDAFYNAVGDTLVVEDTDTAEQLIGQYRMVTLDGKLYEKNSVITGGYVKKSMLGFGQNADKELEAAKEKLDQLQKKYNDSVAFRNELEEKLDKIRSSYSTSSTEYSKAKLELGNMSSQFESSQNLLETKQEFVKENEPKVTKLSTELDKIEAKRVELADQIEQAQDKIAEIDKLLGDKGLKELKEKTQGLEEEIRRLENNKLAVNNEISGFENLINFYDLQIKAKEQDIEKIIKDNKKYEEDKEEFNKDILRLDEQFNTLSDKIAVIDEKIGELVKEKEEIQKSLVDLQTNSAVKASEIERINEQIEAFKTRRKELEPQLESAMEVLKDSGIDVDKLEPVQISIEELEAKIQRLEKRMQELGDVNMRAITTYEEKLARKEELDTQIKTLSEERQAILEKMQGFEQQKKEAFMTTFTAINENFKDIYHQLSEGEGKLILENEQDPLSAGMTMEAKPRDKKTNNKLSSLSGGEKALTALALVFSIQKYLPAPFYALDEVDANLDTMNVEKIADMVKKQSSDTQFLVVSHRRPMIEAAQRTIGVTQKEKGKTKVTGIKQREDDEQ
jgi:chromosome segregation protein